MCKLAFTYMQLRSHAQKYTRVQSIHICIIYTPCVNLRMCKGLKCYYNSTFVMYTLHKYCRYQYGQYPQRTVNVIQTLWYLKIEGKTKFLRKVIFLSLANSNRHYASENEMHICICQRMTFAFGYKLRCLLRLCTMYQSNRENNNSITKFHCW